MFKKRRQPVTTRHTFGGDNIRYFKKPLPDFKDPDIWKSLKRQCYDGTLDYEDYPADEYKYFDKLRELGYLYRAQQIDKAEFNKRDAANFKEYEEFKQNYIRNVTEVAANIRLSEQLRINIRQEKDRDKLLELALECVEVMTGEKGFKRCILEKLSAADK